MSNRAVERLLDPSGAFPERLPPALAMGSPCVAETEGRRRLAAALRAAEEAARRAEARAEEAARAKSAFLASMSHELRTPLNAILGFAQLMLLSGQAPLDKKQRDYVGYIADSGQRLLDLVSELLDLARIEAGTLHLTAEDLDPAALLAEVGASLAPLAEAQGLSFTLHQPAAPVPRIRGDRTRLIQILLNLGSNAIRFNRPAGSVALGLERGAAGRVRLRVTDTGIGIARDRRARLFRPLDRRGEGDGPGIGLGIARQLTYLMGGTLGVVSEPGDGSCFWVELPAVEPAEPSPAAARPRRRAGAPAILTALCIDGDPAQAQRVARLVETVPGARIRHAATGAAGAALAEAERPDVVIVTLPLGDMSGYELVSRLRLMPETAGIPVLAIGGEPAPGYRPGELAGFADHLAGTAEAGDILAAIKRAVGVTWH